MDIVILLFDRFEPLDAIGPYEILAQVPGAKVRFVASEAGRITDVLGSLPVDVPTRCSDVEACDVLHGAPPRRPVARSRFRARPGCACRRRDRDNRGHRCTCPCRG